MVLEIEPAEVARKLKTVPESVVLLDVREPYEREAAAIQPSIHIPMDDIPERAGEIPTDREVIVYCHSGSRSMLVVGFLRGRGFTSVANLAGGIDAWSRKVDPAVPRYA